MGQPLNPPYKILGIGTPIIDSTFFVSDTFIKTLPGQKGTSIEVSKEQFESILIPFKNGENNLNLGGSATNTLKGLSKLGSHCALFGSIGNDLLGKYFEQSLKEKGITPLLKCNKEMTAQVACFVTQDKERTMLSYQATSSELNPSDLKPELFKGVQLVHVEGYLMTNEPFLREALTLAKEAKTLISFDLSSLNLVHRYKKQLIDYLASFVDIVFANQEEAFALTAKESKEGCLILKNLSEIAVVTLGALGAFAAREDNIIFHPSIKTDVIDTTGAGDLFAAGFLHGLLNKKSLLECTRYGTLLSSHVIQNIGAEIPEKTWAKIDFKSLFLP